MLRTQSLSTMSLNPTNRIEQTDYFRETHHTFSFARQIRSDLERAESERAWADSARNGYKANR